MSVTDWLIVTGCCALYVAVGILAGRRQRDETAYFAAARDLPWWAAGISNLATWAALGLVSVPAFVALREGGGLGWLQMELAVPLATVVLLALLAFFRDLELISIYEYLERRFGLEMRLFVAGVFALSRALITAVSLYIAAVLTASALGTPVWTMLLLVGAVAVAYAAFGGLRAVVITDIFQLLLLVGTAVVCLAVALERVGGWSEAVAAFEPDRLRVLRLSWGLAEEPSVPLWGALVGGLFLWVAYHGCDLSQAQRQLATRSADQTRLSLVLHGLLRFPLALLFAAVGIAVGAVFLLDPEALARIPSGREDAMVPTFILHYLPTGVRALAFAGILGAVMSGVDSTLNALAAVTMRDFFRRSSPAPLARELTLARLTTVFWGLVLVALAFLLAGEGIVLERIYKTGALFYGPILGAFLTGVAARRVHGSAMVTGVLVGIGFNVGLWVLADKLFWTWWSLSGCLAAAAVAVAQSAGERQSLQAALRGLILWDSSTWRSERRWLPAYVLLLLWFVASLVLCALLPDWLAA